MHITPSTAPPAALTTPAPSPAERARPTLRRAVRLALGLAFALAPVHALAEPQNDALPLAPGTQLVPPGPGSPAVAPLETDPGQRRAIRGCEVEDNCRGHALTGLREFELEAFGPGPGEPGLPWLDDPYGHERASRGRGVARARTVARPSELRPDLPWLDELELPDLPVRWHERVIRYLEFYKDDPRGRNIMRAWLRRQGRFRALIVERLRRAGLPEDLLYVAMIESSYDPHTRSRVGAGGLWQFMPAGGRIYGLWIDRWIDERSDPVRSTEAACLYFADLYQRFGDWHLALAAYNAGYGAILRSVTRYNTNDYWRLLEYENALPWGTSLYVSKTMAAAIVGRNRAFFGFEDIDEAEPMRWDEVSVPKSVPLGAIARAAGASVEVIQELNPQLHRKRTPPTMSGYVMRVPAGSGPLFATRYPQLRGDWDRYDAYVVAHGERIEDIATVHGISRRKLMSLNGIEHESEIAGGMVLVVPRLSDEDKAKNRAEAEEDLYSSGVPPAVDDELMLVAVPDRDAHIPGKRRVFYRVVTGDSMSQVAHAFGVSLRDLALWNDLGAGAHLHPRMVLQAFVDQDWDGNSAEGAPVALLDDSRLLVVTRGSEEHIALMEQRIGRERIIYTPEKPESFETIGRKFGLDSRDMARINSRPHDTVVEPGEEVVVYKVVDKERSPRAADQAKAKRRSEARRKRGKSKN
ncbi:lytic transglycosylase domain-containing protein [Haliangium ochraceum]|uniref:Lytic transglycosylase catalytic n=1 Tax=Haliangium ochraceum (strain DSM 14365 / JCM 11303 / SMP-2) TaxID=502025 RepID=D0LYX2_HALO1|nr:lytic transglycosylase domain-containing protein [Haliangium ochraceum]ACY14442.1 Lytic transglycosylase catalytic [Haliangium ochraceum DSM 14365]